MKQIIASFLFLLLLNSPLNAQQATPGDGLSEEEIRRANDPLANTKAINLQNYFTPGLYGSGDARSNAMLIRYSQPFANGKILTRFTMPLVTAPSGVDANGTTYESGTGDLNFFATYRLSKEGAKSLIGMGPQVSIPTSSSTFTGADRWQVGAAVIAFMTPSPALQYGALVIYQTSIADDEGVDPISSLQFQPIGLFHFGKGSYLRSTGIWTFNLHSDTYNVPIGFGVGQIVKANRVVFNIFLEPQFTILHEGVGQPVTQIFAGINTQF